MSLPVVFILITVVIDAMGIGLIMPVMPDLIQSVEGPGLASAALWGGLLATVFAAMQFLFGPMIGALSDAHGRRPVLLLALGVMALDYLLMAVAHTIWLLILGRVIGGITAATQSTAAAYMADISKPQDKAANFGLIGAAFGVGFVIGPLLGGLLGVLGVRAPFYAAALLAALNLGFGWLILPETVTDRIRRPFSWHRANPVGALRYIAALPGFGPLLTVSFIYTMAFFVYPAIWVYYGQARFGWGPGTIGASLALFGIGIAIVQGLLMKPILRRLGERNTVIAGLSLDVAVFVILGFVTSGWLALALTPVMALGSVAGPALQGIMSRRAADDQQGELQGVLTGVNAIATIIGPLVMTQTFWLFTSDRAPVHLPGAPFLLAGLLICIAIATFARARGTA